jgi:hypothetical protein
MPSLEAVRKHVAEHPMKDDRGRAQGAVWLVIDEKNAFGPIPTLLRLCVMKKSEASPLEATSMGDADEAIMLQNGHTFWQPLKDCRWAQRSRYRPCTAEGVAL